MRPAILSGAMKIPQELVDVRALQDRTTYRHRPMGLDDGEPDLEVLAHYFEGDFLCVPRQLGIQICNQLHIEIDDQTSEGFPVKFPKVPTPREYQAPLIDKIVDTFNDFYDFIFKAHTGWGKTVGAMLVAARLGVTTLIVVDQDNLKDQWMECLVKLFGFKPEDIGILQGKKFDYKGKAVAIAMVHTLSRRDVPAECRDYFGFMVVDEVHTVGAPTFSGVLMVFAAAYRMGVSATPKRRDDLQKALDHNLGKVRVQANKKHDRSAVYMMKNETVYSFYGNVSKMTGRIFSEITEDGQRNLMIAEAVVWLYESGRDVLILSDRIEQLKELQCLLYYFGIAQEEMGLYTGYDPVWVFAKDPDPSKRPEGLHRERRPDGAYVYAEYCAVNLQMVQKRTPKARLAWIKENARIILGTYGMCAKGFDVPRLSGGVDATPRAQAEQVHGRILREQEGKPVPIWVTIADVNSYRLLFTLAGRIADYLNSSGVLFDWHADGRVEPCDARSLKADMYRRINELKSMRIETNNDGLNTLLTPTLVKESKRTRDRDMVERFKRQPPRPRSQRSSEESDERSTARRWTPRRR